ncbi:MAG: hypothetical protein JJT78_05380 [Leptospira sp.]|nr:hypothetical protein [Leptospira sp.]
MVHYLLFILALLFFPVIIYAQEQEIIYFSFGKLDKGSVHGVAIGPFYNIINDGSLNGLGISVFGQEARKINGVSIGLRNKTYIGNLSGLALAGFYNTSGENDLNGLFISTLYNSGYNLKGLSIAFGFNEIKGQVEGLQVGFGNQAKPLKKGMQIGVGNYAENSSGIQIGILNLSEGDGFIQIGLLNYAKNNWIPFLPLINVNFSTLFGDIKDGEGVDPSSDLQQEGSQGQDR